MHSPYESTLSDDENQNSTRGGSDSDSDSEDDRQRHFSFPELDERIRKCIADYGAVFPKMNFSSPKDASWVLPASSPLKCTCPADVYLLLKSSDFILHDLSRDSVLEGATSSPSEAPVDYQLELVLRKWYPVDRSREFRCFVRDNRLLGISQRDTNFYDYMNESTSQSKVLGTISSFFDDQIRSKMEETRHYTFDFLLTRDLSSGHILDFNPFLAKTDPLLFEYDELLELYQSSDPQVEEREGDQQEQQPRPEQQKSALPKLVVIDSRSHPAANTKAPANQHNMMPFDALNLSSGRDITEFAEIWKEQVEQSSKR